MVTHYSHHSLSFSVPYIQGSVSCLLSLQQILTGTLQGDTMENEVQGLEIQISVELP